MAMAIKLHEHSFLLSGGAQVSFVGGNTLKISGIKMKGIDDPFAYRVEFENDLAVQKALAVGVHRILMDKVNAMDKTKVNLIHEALVRHGEALGSGQSTSGRTSDPLLQEMKRIARSEAAKWIRKNNSELKPKEVAEKFLAQNHKALQTMAEKNLAQIAETEFTIE